ncbi:MAG: carbohydrate binding family 9 domain-containing protein, partial [Planctomycetota bacterium]
MLASSQAPAQDVIPSVKSFSAVRTDAVPVIDGHLDEPLWQRATVIDDMHEVRPDEYGDPSEETRFFVIYGDDAMYIGAEFLDSEPDRMVAKVMRLGDFSEGDDSLKIILDPFNAGRSGYIFHLNPNGIRGDALFRNVTEPYWEWEGIWQAAARVTENGWMAEMAIPFKTLSFDPANETWGINFNRKIGRRNEEIGWVSYNRVQNPANSGQITGLTGLEQGLGLDVVPGLRVSESRDYVDNLSNTEIEPSLDIFFKPTPSLTGALTVNTDFSGTKVDTRQINLTRFSIFLPEQRSFFLQDNDIFEFGRISSEQNGRGGIPTSAKETGRPFFSRRIGLSEDGEAIDIEAGLKLTGRAGRWNFGVLNIRQSDYVTLDDDGNVDQTVDASDLFVGRVAANILEESTIGAIVTSGDPTSNADNMLVGVDFQYLNTRLASGKTLESAVWYQQTDTEGINGDNAAYGFSLKAPNTEGWIGNLSYREIQKNFKPMLGFVSQNDVRDILFDASYKWRPDGGMFRSITTGIRSQLTDTLDGELDKRIIYFDAIRLETHSSDTYSTFIRHDEERITEDFEISEGVIIPPGTYSWTRPCITLGTATHRAVSYRGWYCPGEFYDGDRVSSGTRLNWRPNEHLSVNLSYE